MMNETGLRRTLPEQSLGSAHSIDTPRHPSIIDPIPSKRVCFYKSGDPQFSGLRMVINNRTFKTFDALLDSLSKKVPLPFGVRNITTPRGVHAVYTLDELEDGKSYICSDSRKVKPINLALARKKLPPWYHARPVSSRRRTVQQARFFPGQNIHKKEPVGVRTPKRLLVFRNGDPTVRHRVVLSKRTTPTFESILEYISELLQFHVVKLHLPDGRRVDGLPGLILCSGVVVAAGRETFRPANYIAQKSTAPAMPSTNRIGQRRLKALNRKKKFPAHSSKSRKFSPSSERYIINRIHDSIAESSCDLPSNLTNSVDLESCHMLGSVAETEGDICLGDGAERQDCLLPTEDDIEKSFRVNQDGSMTVEMKVRLTIKEEETIHWTTTLSRSSVASQLNMACLPEPEVEQEIGSLKSSSLDLQSPEASIDAINKDKTEDNNDQDPPSMSSEVLSEINEESHIKAQMDMMSPRGAPTPGYKQIRREQASVESTKSLMTEGIQQGMIGSYSYREQTEHGAMTEQYCMVKQSSTKPVPKPRRLGSMDANMINSKNVTTFKSAGMTEILQIESSGDEVTETVLHIYEQQTCQDNFHANLCAQGVTAAGIPFCRPATSGTGQISFSNEFEPEYCRPSTASESISIWRTESMSITSDLTFPSHKTGATEETKPWQQVSNPSKGKDKPQKREVNKGQRVSSKPKVIKRRVHRLMSPEKKQKENSAEATEKRKKMKTFSSAGFIRKIYGNKSKSPKSPMKLKKGPTLNGDGGVATKSSQQSDYAIKCILKDPNIPSALKENTSESVSLEKIKLSVSFSEVSQPRGILTRQTSMHKEKNGNELHDVSESLSLPAFNSSSSVTNEYVENWLEKAHLNPTACRDAESKKLEAVTLLPTENIRSGDSENKNGLMAVAEQVKRLEEASEIQTSKTLKTDLSENLKGASVKQRIQSFENKSSSPSIEKTTVNQQITHSHTTTTNTDNLKSFSQDNTEETKPFSHHYSSENISPTSGNEVENKSNPVKISLQNATPSSTLSMELLPPPPPAEDMEMDLSSVASSPLYRLSSMSSQMSDNHPLSISPTSDNPTSPTDHTMEVTSTQTDVPSTLKEAPLSRAPSIKRAPLVSNLSLDRKMSLRKACLDKYTVCSDAISSTPINTVGGNVLPNSVCSTGTQQLSETPTGRTEQSNNILDLKNSPSCTSASPASLPSDERMPSASISSSEPSPTSDLPFKETKTNKTALLAKTEASSPKPLVKNVQIMSSPSPDRIGHTMNFSSELPHNSPELSSIHIHPPDKTMSPTTGKRKHATPNPSPSTDRKQMNYKPKLQKTASPYAQSLDMTSTPGRHKSSPKLLSRNYSSDNASELTGKPQRKTSSERKRQQASKSKSQAEPDRTCNTVSPLEANQSDGNKVNREDDLVKVDQERSMAETKIMPQPLNIPLQPNMEPVLEEICYSIKSIRQITHNKRPSCLGRSNSLPDFSSHVASTFGSSSKALLAFLSLMTLKEGINSLNMDELNASDVSCAEALKMIDSLREIAGIEDSHKLKDSLSTLQQSASKQLLQSWKGFQELSNKCRSQSSTPSSSEQELKNKTSPNKDCGVDEIIENLDIPERLKEELAALSVGATSESDDEEKMSAKNNEKVERNVEISTVDAYNVKDATQNEKANVGISAMIKKYTDINQPKQSSVGITETAKHKPTPQASGSSAELNNEQIHEGEELYVPVLLEKDNGKGMQSCEDKDKSSQERRSMEGVVSSKESHEQGSCTSEVEEKNMEDNQLLIQGEENMSIPEKEQTSDEESGSDQEETNTSSANKNLEQNGSCEQGVFSSQAFEQLSLEEEPEDESWRVQQESRESDDLCNHESHSEEEEEEEEEEEQPSSDYYVELNVRGNVEISSADNTSQKKYSSDEEQLDVEYTKSFREAALSNPASPSTLEKEQQRQAGSMGLNVIVDESTCNSDVEEPYSEEEQTEEEFKELKEITEEGVSGNEGEQESTGEEEPPDDLPDQTEKCDKLKAFIDEKKEGKVSSGDEGHHADKTEISDETKSQNAVEEDLTNLIENLDPYTRKESSDLIKSDSLGKDYTYNTDDDSGNDHSSCEEHVEIEQPKVEDEQIRGSIEEELSDYEKESSSEEEHANVDGYTEESCTEYHKPTKEFEVPKREKHPSEISQSIAERVILLEKQVADAQRRQSTTKRSPKRRFSQRNAPLDSDVEDSPSELPPSQSTQSAPQSSLSFSYDSSNVITTEPEGNRVRFIREMFLAKNATDIQQGHKHFPSPNTSKLSELRAETSASGGYQSQTSSELSSGEDDSARKSITKGFVRRTIERLYGKKDANPDEEISERPPSAPKEKKKEHSSVFSPFHNARAKAMSELSYFNSTNALDTLSEATRCITFNTQVGPGDSVPIDNGQWLLKENALIRKSVSDPVGINKTLSNIPQGEEMCKDTEENPPYSLFSTNSEPEDKKKSYSRKCTYFSLPHASDSEACQDDLSTVSKSSLNGDSIIDTKDISEDTKQSAERNGRLPGIGVTDFKMMDNKVHPLTEQPADGEVVVAQPERGQGVMTRRLYVGQEPDMLDILYDFCGQNCPIL